MFTDRKSSSEVRALWHLQDALKSSGIVTDGPESLKRAEHIRHILQSGGATEPERLARALDRLADTLKA